MADNITAPGAASVLAFDDITDGGVANGAKAARSKTGFGADGFYTDVAAASPLPTYQPNYANVIASNVITRSANTTAYAAGGLVGASGVSVGAAGHLFTFSSVANANGGFVDFNGFRLFKTNNTKAGFFQLILFRASPTFTVADQGILENAVTVGNAASTSREIGRVNFDMSGGFQGSDGAIVRGVLVNASIFTAQAPVASRDIVGLLISTGVYTPISNEQFSIVAETRGY
jgi:hypothetical protein